MFDSMPQVPEAGFWIMMLAIAYMVFIFVVYLGTYIRNIKEYKKKW